MADTGTNYFNRQIMDRRNEIEKKQREINEGFQAQAKKYFELRKILEDERNHEDRLICKPLKPDKLREYKIRLNEYKEIYSDYKKTEVSNLEEIDKLLKEINNYKKMIFDLEKTDETVKAGKFEEERREKLKDVIGYIHDKKEYREYYNTVMNIMDNKTKY